jgi:hypothetical protein
MLRVLRALRRSGALLLGVLLLHTSWLAASAACERSVTAAAPVAAAPSSHAHHAPADSRAPHHGPTTVTCPTVVPTVTVPQVAIDATLAQHNERMPRSSRVAPEPPPPRA